MYEDNLDTLCPITFAEQIQMCHDVACGVERLHSGYPPIVLSSFTKYDVLVTDWIRKREGEEREGVEEEGGRRWRCVLGNFFRATILVGSEEVKAAELRDFNLLSGLFYLFYFIYLFIFFLTPPLSPRSPPKQNFWHKIGHFLARVRILGHQIQNRPLPIGASGAFRERKNP